MVIGINCGHTLSGTVGSGAVGFINESDETRAVGYSLMRLLTERHTVVDCTDNNAPTVLENLRRICALANAQRLDMFLSIHFNAGGGRGCEAYTMGAKDTANAVGIVENVAALGFADRGIKDGSSLYVIRNTVSPPFCSRCALLIRQRIPSFTTASERSELPPQSQTVLKIIRLEMS